MGGAGSGGTPSTGGATSGGAGGASSGGASGGGSGGATGGSGGGAPITKSGSISLVQTVTVVGGSSYPGYAFSAGFYDSGSTGATASCTTSDQGACTLTDCTTTGSADAGTPQASSAGSIVLGGALQALSLVPATDATYPAATGQSLLWNEGAQLSVQASGDTVPSFSTTLNGVGVISLSSPVLTPGSPITVDRTSALSVAWSGSATGEVGVSLSRSEQSSGTTHSVLVLCYFPASSAGASVPASVLGAIPAGDNGALSVFGSARQELDAGEWKVYVNEISGSNASLVTFQ
jgi:hypothetical protein